MTTEILNNPGFYMSYAVIQAVVLLLLIRLVDLYERQPLLLLALMAVWGATGAAAVALVGNEAVKGLLSGDARVVFGNTIAPPLVEEATKGLALLAAIGPIRWLGKRLGIEIFDGVTAGIVYGAAVGLGFGFTEDFFYFVQLARVQSLESGLDIFLYRRDFFGPAVLHHPLFTAAFGAGLGLAVWSRRWWVRIAFPLLGLGIAVLMHAANNGLVELVLVLRYGLEATAAWVNGAAVSLEVDDTASTLTTLTRVADFCYIAFFVAAAALWLRYQRKVIRNELLEEVGSGLVSHDDWTTMFRYWRWRAKYWRLFRSGQLEQWRHVRRVHRRLTHLALQKWRVRRFGGDWARVQRLRREVATLMTFETRPSNLPKPATPLVGRANELEATNALFRRVGARVVTLTGPGGTGKTRLALELGAHLRDEFPSGVFFVALAPIREPEVAIATIAQTLDVGDREGEPPLETLKDYLRDKQLLLVLDNFEQVLAAAPVVAELLTAAPRLRVLATSREPLRLSGEQEYLVPPLALPDLDAAADVESLASNEAVTLFVQRARAAEPAFELSAANARPVADICRRLDGLPLAIELAAARVKLLSPQAMLERLQQPLSLLAGGARDFPERHQTLRATIDWSYGLLDAAEQTLFGRLAVFVGGCRLEAAEAVCGRGVPSAELLDGIASLVEKSLLRRERQGDGEPRFRMLETIRDYALERLAERGGVEELKRRHAEHCVALAEAAEPELTGAGQVAWLGRLDEENDNIRTALTWSIEAGEVEIGLRIAGALIRFRSVRGYLTEGRKWLRDLLGADGEVTPRVRAKALFAAGYGAIGQGDFLEAKLFLEESLALAQQVGDERLQGASLAQIGWLVMARGKHEGAYDEHAFQLAEKSLELARKTGDKLTASGALSVLAEVATQRGEDARATELFQESLALRRESGDLRLVANSLLSLGRSELTRGRLEAATALLEEGLALARELRDTWSMSLALSNLGRVKLHEGDYTEAAALFAEGLRLARERGDKRVAADCLQGLAVVSWAQGQPERAAQVWGAAEAMLEAMGATPSPAERSIEERFLPLVRADLEEDAFAAAWTAGRALAPEVAISGALAAPAAPAAGRVRTRETETSAL